MAFEEYARSRNQKVGHESSEAYLFPAALFLPITLPHEAAVAVRRLAV